MTGALPLAGKRILVTRARTQAGRLSEELRKLGAEPVEIPAIEIVAPETFAALDGAIGDLARFDWLIVTSTNAVRAILERCEKLGVAAGKFSALKIAAIGATTARALEEAGLPVSVTPKEYVGESLVEALANQADGARVLIVRAAVARDVIPGALAGRGAAVEVVEAYRTVVPEESVVRLAEVFAEKPPEAATFTSSSTVTNFFHLLRAAGFDRRLDGMVAVSIGPITSQTLREHGWEPAAEADPHDVAGLVGATVRALLSYPSRKRRG
ncbi:MAG: uroporphyrinogen-III synthase [Acidobacteriaceae bacterium]